MALDAERELTQWTAGTDVNLPLQVTTFGASIGRIARYTGRLRNGRTPRHGDHFIAHYAAPPTAGIIAERREGGPFCTGSVSCGSLALWGNRERRTDAAGTVATSLGVPRLGPASSPSARTPARPGVTETARDE
jgi:hypothetical protein